MARIWEHFEERISPLIEDNDNDAASQPGTSAEGMFDDVANSLLSSFDINTPNEVIMLIYILKLESG